MTSLSLFGKIQGVALLALLAVSLVVAAYGFVDSLIFEDALLTPGSAAWVGFSYTMIIGTPLVLILGGPIYFWLARTGNGRWSFVIALGVAPGLILLLVHRGLGAFAVLCGLVIASIMHVICARRSSNRSLKSDAAKPRTLG